MSEKVTLWFDTEDPKNKKFIEECVAVYRKHKQEKEKNV